MFAASTSTTTHNDNAGALNHSSNSSSNNNVIHIDISGMNHLLDETDQDTGMLAWMALNRDEDSTDEFDDDDDNSVDYLAEAVSDFFRKICFWGCPAVLNQHADQLGS
jgi:hypothetical protein